MTSKNNSDSRSPAISFNSATKIFNKVVALDRLSLDVYPGELFGFLGPNGAGKTTALKLLAGLVKPTNGSTSVEGLDVQTHPLEAKRLVGYVPDSPHIYESLTGREFLHYCSGLYRLARDETEWRIEELLKWFDIEEWVDKRIGEYSHGMKQRVVLAAAFLHRPKVILIDEPMVGLDPAGVRLIKEVLCKFCSNGGAVFLSTHTLPDAEELCHRIGIIHRGKLVKLGTVDEIRSDSDSLEDAFFKLTARKR